MMSAETVARKIVRTVGRNKPQLVISFGGKTLVLLSALWPRLVDWMMGFYYRDLGKRLKP